MDEALLVLPALGQELRLRALRLLVKRGPEGMFAGEIAERLEVRANTLSSALQILEQAGLVASSRQGRHVRYGARVETISRLAEFLLADCCGGEASRCGLPRIENEEVDNLE